VNDEYQSFLGLGSSLRGGDEKVQEVRVGVLGFRKGVEGVKGVVEEREREVGRAVREREEVRREIGRGRALVRVGERVEELEEELALREGLGGEEWVDEEEEETDADEEEVGMTFVSFTRLRRLVHLSVSTRNQIEGLGGAKHPFLAKMVERMTKIRRTLLLDLGTALKQAKLAGKAAIGRTIKLLGLYSDLDESAEAIQVLKEVVKR
jgi:hypothetical protein